MTIEEVYHATIKHDGRQKHVFKQLLCKSMSYIITYHN